MERTLERFDQWLQDVETENPALRRRGPKRRPRGKVRQQKLSSLALARPFASRSAPTLDYSKSAGDAATPTRFPLQPAPREQAAAAALRLQSALAAAAALPGFEAGHSLWALLPQRLAVRVPPTLALVGDKLVWCDVLDGRLVRTVWDFEGGKWRGLGKRERATMERRLSTRLQPAAKRADSDDDDDGEQSRRGRALRRLSTGPIAVLKVAPGACFRGRVGDAAPSGQTTEVLHDGSAVQAALAALLDGGPAVGSASMCAASVVLQAYVRPKGPSAWVVRAVVPGDAARVKSGGKPLNLNHAAPDADRRLPYAWVVSDVDPFVTASNCRGCTVVRSVPSAASWAEPKALARRALQGVAAAVGRRFDELAADFVQDQGGEWWLLQLKGYKLADGKAIGNRAIEQALEQASGHTAKRAVVDECASRAPADDDSNQPAERACCGDACSQPIPAADAHAYEGVRGAPYSLPRKVIVEARATSEEEAFKTYSNMSKRDRLTFYDNVHVCAACHYAYVGRERLHNVKAAALRKPRYDEVLREARADAALPQIARRRADATPATSPVAASRAKTKLQADDGPSEAAVAAADEDVPSDDRGAAEILMAAMTDIDAIHSQATAAMSASAVSAAQFLSDLDALTSSAYDAGARNIETLLDKQLSQRPLPPIPRNDGDL
ncbi:hypothetical protein M885DRAFT_610903 [Pelagophyceae sp. CCMP2097]|nr:hypothetical protein M885DRAFT_610903 [Pelagophyceae sp. CCMP2097]